MTPYYGTGRRTDWLAGWLGYTHWTAVIIDLPPSLPFPLLVLTPLYSLSPSFLPSPSSSSLFFPCIPCHSTTTRIRTRTNTYTEIHTRQYTRTHTHQNAHARTTETHTNTRKRTHAHAHTAGRRTWRRWTREKPDDGPR